MPTPLIPQEIFLLERYCSLERLEKVRDTWRAMLDHAEDMMVRYMTRLPHDLRSRPSFEQPDFVWGGKVLPNFRETAIALEDACVKRAAGDYEALARAVGVKGDARGFRDGHTAEWMDEVQADGAYTFYKLLSIAEDLADPIDRTTSGIWRPGALTTRYVQVIKEPMDAPPSWPVYRLNANVQMRSGDRTPQTGIYLPDIEGGFPTLLLKHDDELRGRARRAKTDSGYVSCTWTLAERVADSGGGIPGEDQASSAEMLESLRCPAGQPCLKTGYWMTPAKLDSRRYFKQGDVMPDLGSNYGATIWQWDVDQGAQS
ncbi:MAG: hypothetical protein H6R19_2943 [Proteobacteria bacterium]|nr:hypothetical protein [Pseudomonadota bacterium]